MDNPVFESKKTLDPQTMLATSLSNYVNHKMTMEGDSAVQLGADHRSAAVVVPVSFTFVKGEFLKTTFLPEDNMSFHNLVREVKAGCSSYFKFSSDLKKALKSNKADFRFSFPKSNMHLTRSQISEDSEKYSCRFVFEMTCGESRNVEVKIELILLEINSGDELVDF